MFEQVLKWTEKLLPEPHGPQLSVKLRGLYGNLTSDSAKGKSARAALLVFCIRIISAALAFVLQVFLARWMGSTQYGVFVLVWVVAIVLGGMSCFGLQTAVIRFITEYRSKNDRARLHGILITAPAVSIVVSVLVVLTGYFTLRWFGEYVTAIYVLPFYLALICLPMLALEEIQDGIARSFDMPLTALGPSFIVRPAGILVVMIIAYLLGFPPNAKTAISAAIIATFVATIFQSLVLWRRVFRVIRVELPNQQRKGSNNEGRTKYKFQFRYWITVALPVFMAGGFYDLLTNIDVMFIGYFLSPEKVAVYFAALKTLALVHFVHFALRAASAHHFSRYFSDNDIKGLSEYVSRITQWTFWPTLILAAIMVLAGKYILALFGAGFAEGQSLLAILAVGIVGRAAIGPAESLLSMTGQQNISVLVLAVTLLCNLVLNISLIPLFGMAGAAIATSAAMVFESAALYVAVNRKLGLNIFVFGTGRISSSKGRVA